MEREQDPKPTDEALRQARNEAKSRQARERRAAQLEHRPPGGHDSGGEFRSRHRMNLDQARTAILLRQEMERQAREEPLPPPVLQHTMKRGFHALIPTPAPEDIEKVAARKYTIAAIAAYYGVCLNTVIRWRKDEKIDNAIARGRARWREPIESAMALAARIGDQSAAKFLLTASSDSEWVERTRVEQTGADGGPIRIEAAVGVVSMTVEERVTVILAASTRGDEDEIDSLWSTCPREHVPAVRLRLIAFSAPVGRLARAWSACMQLRAAGEAVHRIFEILPRHRSARQAIVDACMATDELPFSPADGVVMARFLWRAWERFADAMGTNARDPIGIHAPWILADLEKLAPDFEEWDARHAGTPDADRPQDRSHDVAALFSNDYERAISDP